MWGLLGWSRRGAIPWGGRGADEETVNHSYLDASPGCSVRAGRTSSGSLVLR